MVAEDVPATSWTRLGLLTVWGELFTLANSRLRDTFLRTYPTPEGALTIGRSTLAVTTTSSRLHPMRMRPDAQPRHVLSLTVVHDISPKALRVGDLIRELTQRTRDKVELAAAFRRRGIVSRLGASDLPFVLAAQPLLFDGSAIPSVREADGGVGVVEYDAWLDPALALDGEALAHAASVYGLERLVHD